MHSNAPIATYFVSLAVILRAAWALFAQALRRPGAPFALTRDGRVLPR